MEQALEQLIGQGVLGIFLVLVIWYFKYEIKQLREEMKAKSLAHADDMKLKDDKIQQLNDIIRQDAIENVSLFKDLQGNLKDLVTELKVRNNG